MAEYAVADWRKFGAVVRDARRARGVSQVQLAAQAGVSRAWLAKVEAGGHRRAELEQIFQLLTALGLGLVLREERSRSEQYSQGELAVLDALARRRDQSTS